MKNSVTGKPSIEWLGQVLLFALLILGSFTTSATSQFNIYMGRLYEEGPEVIGQAYMTSSYDPVTRIHSTTTSSNIPGWRAELPAPGLTNILLTTSLPALIPALNGQNIFITERVELRESPHLYKATLTLQWTDREQTDHSLTYQLSYVSPIGNQGLYQFHLSQISFLSGIHSSFERDFIMYLGSKPVYVFPQGDTGALHHQLVSHLSPTCLLPYLATSQARRYSIATGPLIYFQPDSLVQAYSRFYNNVSVEVTSVSFYDNTLPYLQTMRSTESGELAGWRVCTEDNERCLFYHNPDAEKPRERTKLRIQQKPKNSYELASGKKSSASNQQPLSDEEAESLFCSLFNGVQIVTSHILCPILSYFLPVGDKLVLGTLFSEIICPTCTNWLFMQIAVQNRPVH